MYSENAHLGKAGAPFLLSVVGWFLLCNLALKSKIEESTGLDIAPMVFGVGTAFYTVGVISVF